jgi:hypothetical protein
VQSGPFDLNERVRLNELLDGYLDWPEWTPAVGAMLISGVRPPGMLCTAIPDIAPSLRSETTAANPRSLDEARKALKTWVEGQTEDSECTSEEALSMTVTLFDFFAWCEDEYGSRGDSFKPSWLDYWFGHIGWGGRDGIPRPAPRELVARAAKLELIELYLRQQVFVGQLPGGGEVFRTAEEQARVDQMCTAVQLRSKLPFKRVLIKALRKASDPTDPKEVYDELFKFARQGAMPAHLRVESNTLIRFLQSKNKWVLYTTDALRQLLADYDPEQLA